MKFAKLSLAAIMAMGVSAFADVQNIKVSGDAKLFYGTNEADEWNGALGNGANEHKPQDPTLFGQDNSYGQAAVDLAVSADLSNGVAGKISFVALSTLGLENNLVSDTWAGDQGGVSTQWWANEAWIAKTLGKTTIKVGRQELDTPLAFSEKWNIAANSFDAAVVLNQDLPKTTLVAAWVGKGNGTGTAVVRGGNNGDTNADMFRTFGSAIDDTLDNNASAGTVNAAGAYAVAAITTAIPMTTAQVWYYNVNNIAKAYWLQADVSPVKGLTIGVQYANIDVDNSLYALTNQTADNILRNADSSSAWAAKVGYAMGDLSVSAAYSSTDKDGIVDVANTATGLKGSQSKLYTEAWWSYGYVGAPATDAYTLTAEYSLKDVADFDAYYTHTSYDHTAKNATVVALIHGDAWNTNKDVEMDEFTLTASKKLGSLDATLAYIYTDADDQNKDANGNGQSYNTVQVYLTYNF